MVIQKGSWCSRGCGIWASFMYCHLKIWIWRPEGILAFKKFSGWADIVNEKCGKECVWMKNSTKPVMYNATLERNNPYWVLYDKEKSKYPILSIADTLNS